MLSLLGTTLATTAINIPDCCHGAKCGRHKALLKLAHGLLGIRSVVHSHADLHKVTVEVCMSASDTMDVLVTSNSGLDDPVPFQPGHAAISLRLR